MLYTWPVIFNSLDIIDSYFIPFHFCLDVKCLYTGFVCYLISITF